MLERLPGEVIMLLRRLAIACSLAVSLLPALAHAATRSRADANLRRLAVARAAVIDALVKRGEDFTGSSFVAFEPIKGGKRVSYNALTGGGVPNYVVRVRAFGHRATAKVTVPGDRQKSPLRDRLKRQLAKGLLQSID
jgi:hypothetical protein